MNKSVKVLAATLVIAVLALSVVSISFQNEAHAWLPKGVKLFGNSNGGNGGIGGNGGSAFCTGFSCNN